MEAREVTMASKQYTDEFKAEAVKQVAQRGFAVAEVAKRLGVSSHSLYQLLHKAKSEALAGTPEGSMLPTHKDSAEVRGKCHDNAVAESFFSALKKEWIKRRIYPTRDEARSDVFKYIEMFHNPIRRLGSAGNQAPVGFERRYAQNGLMNVYGSLACPISGGAGFGRRLG
jgi:transposase-like protein